MAEQPAKIGIICGSQRPQSQSARVGQYLSSRLGKKSVDYYFLDLGLGQVPFWDETLAASSSWQQSDVSKALKACAGFVVISPEWSGMVPPVLKNLFLLCSNQELAHKPAMIVAVSSGRGGSYPVAELRTSSYKNSKICYIPDHVIVRGVQEYLNTPDPTSKEDGEVRQRLDHGLEMLLLYAEAMQPIRQSKLVSESPFPFGM